MKKKLFLLLLLLTMSCPIKTTFAEQTESIPFLISSDQKQIEGSIFLTKVYEVAEDFDPSALVENGYKKDGYLFAYHKTDKKVNENKQTKELSESIAIETATDNKQGILNRLPQTIEYNKEDFTGVLSLKQDSIATEVAAYKTQNTTLSTVKEYTELMATDNSYIPQTAEKEGQTLQLTDVNWAVMGTGLSGDTLVPTEYKATATYSKTISDKVPSSYVTTAIYTGTVSKPEPTTITYTLTYVGTPIKENSTIMERAEKQAEEEIKKQKQEEKPEVKEIKQNNSILIKIILGAFIGVLFSSGMVLLFYKKSQRGVKIYNLQDEEYICIGYQKMNKSDFIIDLNPLHERIQSPFFYFVIDKYTAKKLYDKTISITLHDETKEQMIIPNSISEYGQPYCFMLEIGGTEHEE
ncbi:hypothetical protein [Clostridium sp. MD294]|uniref:hypothetical protein n=1 Tax=Clostridium sp. MD294 TaxID=97138 RepID=UPI0002CACB48|nr:hypothetical protein [Clostridium sp. MD294]NDO47834.1 hypothetical protein [Clostridium sp. MD294]USF29844.1 hypothetical protein C820_001252 [Clostridium sp. MD294]